MADVRRQIGYPSAYSACVAQRHLTIDQYRNRESGRAAISLEEFILLANDWGKSPIELFCLLSEAMDSSAFAPVAQKLEINITEARQRFKAKQLQTGMAFEQLFLLVLKDQIQI